MTAITSWFDSTHCKTVPRWSFFEKSRCMPRLSNPLLNEAVAIEGIEDKATPLFGKDDLQPLFDKIGDAELVLLGEASHGTHEYYTWRNYITQQLITEKGFRFVGVEGDWPDCYQLNRYCKNYSYAGTSALNVLQRFNRWPTWMWANWEMVAFAEWLAKHNQPQNIEDKVGFYGLDVYSLWESIEAIRQYLRHMDPIALKAAEEAFRCFAPFQNNEGGSYAKATGLVPDLCADEVVELLRKIQERLPQYNTDAENVFNVEQNALVALHAEQYYRAMLKGGPHSWNLRDKHMMETLDRLLLFHGQGTKAVVWAHNTHIGDASATTMVNEGMLNLGELVRLRHRNKGVVLVGFGSYKGEVVAANGWGAPMCVTKMPAAQRGSWEHLLHKVGQENKLLLMEDLENEMFWESHIAHRAIGVVYNPEYEQYGNYVASLLPLRYDAFIYLDHTTALHPLHIKPDGHQTPETYPFGV